MPKVLIVKERAEGETRVAATPETVKRLVKEGYEVIVETNAGEAAHLTDDAYRESGARVVDAPSAAEANLLLRVTPPTPEEASAMAPGAVLIGLMAPYKNLKSVAALRDRKISTFAMELVPRISRAQSMDALSSQASIAGYKAVLLAASQLDKYFPLLMTAAGTVQPARVVIMGAGVAGLQAVATAKRLGAIVEVSDIRAAVKEQVESLGGRFIDLPMQEGGEGAGGYAREVTKDFLEKQQAIVAAHVKGADVVITTALVPGKPAPKLVTQAMVESMRPGSVIVDLAVEQGGNCELSELNHHVVKHGVLILGDSNLPATMPLDASMLYARNLAAVVKLMTKDANLVLDLEDEIIQGALLTHAGEVRHGPTREALGSAA